MLKLGVYFKCYKAQKAAGILSVSIVGTIVIVNGF